MSNAEARVAVAQGLRRYAAGCGALGSALYADLLAQAALDVERGGPAWELLRGHAGDPAGSALALRFAAALHRLVLEGDAPRLARHYPSAGGDAQRPGLWHAVEAVLAERGALMRALVREPIQTNEVGRCVALLPGFLLVARLTGRPLRVLEIGASAGLNLLWDRYRYESAGWSLGDDRSPVRFVDTFRDVVPPPGPLPEVASRRGCDLRPLDPGADATRLKLLSCTWPDQPARIERLLRALEIAREDPPAVDRAVAADWLDGQLAGTADGHATVVVHSIVWQYLSASERRRLRRTLDAAGQRATREAPLAWLRMEPRGALTEVRVTIWPGSASGIVARAGYHGDPVLPCRRPRTAPLARWPR
jgi:hypothetical protein